MQTELGRISAHDFIRSISVFQQMFGQMDRYRWRKSGPERSERTMMSPYCLNDGKGEPPQGQQIGAGIRMRRPVERHLDFNERPLLPFRCFDGVLLVVAEILSQSEFSNVVQK